MIEIINNRMNAVYLYLTVPSLSIVDRRPSAFVYFE